MVRQILCLSLFLFSSICNASAQTEAETYARELSLEITEALEDGDAGEVLALVSAYKQLGIRVPGQISIAEGQAHLLSDDLQSALSAYETAIRDSNLSSVERVRSSELIRRIEGTLLAEAERLEEVRRLAQIRLETALENPTRLIQESTLTDITDLFEGLDDEAKSQLWWRINGGYDPELLIRHNAGEGADFSERDFHRVLGYSTATRSGAFQRNIMCSEDSEARQRFFSVVFGEAGVNERLVPWLRYPAPLPRECWPAWSALLASLNADPRYIIHDSESERDGGRYAFNDSLVQYIDGKIELGYSPAAYMFMDYLEQVGYRSNISDVRLQHYELNDLGGISAYPSTLSEVHSSTATLQLLELAGAPLHFFYEGGTQDYYAAVSYYRDVIGVVGYSYPGGLERMKFHPCYRSYRITQFNLLFWRAAQLEGFDLPHSLPSDCYLGTYDVTIPASGGRLQRVARPSMPVISEMFAYGADETYNQIVADFLIDAGVDLSVSWGRDEDFPLLFAARTGQCSVYTKLKDAGARDYGRRARRAIRQLDANCR